MKKNDKTDGASERTNERTDEKKKKEMTLCLFSVCLIVRVLVVNKLFIADCLNMCVCVCVCVEKYIIWVFKNLI